MPKVENSTAVYRIAELRELAEIFESLARRSVAKGIHPQQARGAILAFTLAASITRRTIIGGNNDDPEDKPRRRGK